MQTLETTASGYLGGLPLRLLTGYRPELIADALGLRPVPEHWIDPAVLPGLRYPAPGGAGADDVTAALRLLLATGRVAAVGVACTWHPGHDAAARIEPQLTEALVNL